MRRNPRKLYPWNGPTKASCWACGGRSSAIVELLTRGHGRHLGLVRGGASSRMRPLLQPGNSVTAVWRARLDEHLGACDRHLRAQRCSRPRTPSGVTHLASLARLLPERDPHEDIYEMLDRTLDDFDDAGGAAATSSGSSSRCWPNSASASIWKNCAATGETADLIYVSPSPAARCRGGPASPTATGCCGCRRSCAKGEGGANGWSDQDLQDGFG